MYDPYTRCSPFLLPAGLSTTFHTEDPMNNDDAAEGHDQVAPLGTQWPNLELIYVRNNMISARNNRWCFRVELDTLLDGDNAIDWKIPGGQRRTVARQVLAARTTKHQQLIMHALSDEPEVHAEDSNRTQPPSPFGPAEERIEVAADYGKSAVRGAEIRFILSVPIPINQIATVRMLPDVALKNVALNGVGTNQKRREIIEAFL